MKKRFILILLTLSLIMAVGCANEEPADTNSQNTDNVEEIEIGDVDDAEVVEIPYDEIRAESIKVEELGEYTLVREKEGVDVSAENQSTKVTVTDYNLNTLIPKDEYREFFMELESEDVDEVAILNITLEFENLSNDILEIDNPNGVLYTNTGEEIPVILEFFEDQHEDIFKLSGKEIKKANTSAILSSKAEDIESFKLVYNGLEIDFK